MIFFVAKFQMNSRYLALAAAFIATTIYGINHTVAKEVMPVYIGSAGFIMLRLLGATVLFWMISFFTPKEKIEYRDRTDYWNRRLHGKDIKLIFSPLSFAFVPVDANSSLLILSVGLPNIKTRSIRFFSCLIFPGQL